MVEYLPFKKTNLFEDGLIMVRKLLFTLHILLASYKLTKYALALVKSRCVI